YRHLIWITDIGAAKNDKPGTDGTDPICALRYMCAKGRANSVSAYIKQGGEVWFLGGGVAVASTIAYNNKNNDLTPPAPGMTFSGAAPLSELAPGTMMYDMAHWRSEIKSAGGAPVTFTRFFGRYGNSPPPGYETFPLSMRPKAAD